MKRISVYKLLAFLITATIFVSSCTKENPDVRLAPTLSTSQVYDVKSDSATVVGFVVAAGGGFTERGICYNTDTIPTITNSKVVYTGDQTTATFIVKLGGLNYATKYYTRAYATNATGTIYGEEYTFTTLPILPTVETAAITSIAGISATGGGNITNDGGTPITARGVCYGLTANPTILDSKTVDGTGAGEFVSELVGLSGLTTYHVRAYAINSVGIVYGNDVEFTTLVATRSWNIPGDYVAASYPGYTFNDWDPAASPKIQSLESGPDNLEGYVYMANATNQWKIATKLSWDGPNYGDGGPGVLNPDATAANMTAPAGYYKINVNASTLTYTAVATEWGVIGNSTPGGWDDETPLTYVPSSREWRGGMTLVAGEFKFRANHSWDFNYGSTAGNATLNFGGDNIPLTLAGDYYFIMDLSNPNAYTYSANTWGLIGDATPGAWDSDQNMTWDPALQAMTITVDLIAGSMKFRANDAWDLNLGGDPNALTVGGDNIAVTVPGNYTITLYLVGGAGNCTIVKN